MGRASTIVARGILVILYISAIFNSIFCAILLVDKSRYLWYTNGVKGRESDDRVEVT